MTGPKSADQNDDPAMPFVYLNITDTLDQLTIKHMETLRYVYENLMNEFDWFVYANDDAYMIIENMRHFLADKCPNEKILYGKVMKHSMLDGKDVYTSGDNTRGFIQGGSGWLVSRESIRLFGEARRKNPHFCQLKIGAWEDQDMSDCYRKIDVYPGESRDSDNRERFLMNKFDEYKYNFEFC